jgi:hypothetical protein
MLNKVITVILDWALTSIILPLMYLVYDVFKLRKENKELKKNIEVLKNAKTKEDIDRAIDNIP